ncbi:MAG: 1-acyl-sn-glycerol-3-phosphate acyltransferase [Clostridiales bacterium]|nr:1-acyl-sn-glycerol-3-phosphate acyltransferase [Clostridiales bacterium]
MGIILYCFGLAVGLLLQPFWFKTKTYYEDGNKQNKRIKGGALIITNHRSFLDGIVIIIRFFFKRLYFIAADYYKGRLKIFKRVMRSLGGIFVDKDAHNMDFIEKSKRVTAKGKAIMIFPEGDYKFTYEPSKFAPGYIMLAVKTGAKIVPIVNDFNYGLFKRVHLMVGNSIDLSVYSGAELSLDKLNEINDEINGKFLTLFYKLKRKKSERFSNKFEFNAPNTGDVIRVFVGSHHHYGVYLNAGEVIQFGHAVNIVGENVSVNSVPLKEFCGSKIPEVRVLKRSERRFKRNPCDIERYAKSCLGHGGYSIDNNNCLDFANRMTLKI